MKKTLLLQTALVAAAGLFVADVASAQVKAEPLAATVGGYFNQFYKVQDRDKDTAVDQRPDAFSSDAEIWFNIRGVLDNGTVIGGRVELEAASYGDQIDERYLFVERADIGRVELGSTDRVTGKMLYFAPNSLPGHGTTVHYENSATPNAPLMWFANANHDKEGINVYTASNRYFGSKAGKGLQLGFSYVPDGCEDFDAQGSTASTNSGFCTNSKFGSSANAGQVSAQYAAAANYLETFGQVDAALYAGYNSVNREATTASTATASGAGKGRVDGWQLGTTLTYNVGDGSSVALGGGYTKEDLSKRDGATLDRDRKAWTVGLRYLTNGAAPGSIGVGVEFYRRSDSNTLNGAAAGGAANTGDQDLDYYHLGLTYQVAAGVLAFAGVGVSDLDQPGNIGSGTGSDSKQTFGVVGLGLTF